jgi:hypothetical protein
MGVDTCTAVGAVACGPRSAVMDYIAWTRRRTTYHVATGHARSGSRSKERVQGNVRGWEKNHWDAPRMWAHHAIENSIEWSRGPGTTDDVRDESVRP